MTFSKTGQADDGSTAAICRRDGGNPPRHRRDPDDQQRGWTATNVGRVGALAAALGVGAIVHFGQAAPAHAAPNDSSSTESTSDEGSPTSTEPTAGDPDESLKSQKNSSNVKGEFADDSPQTADDTIDDHDGEHGPVSERPATASAEEAPDISADGNSGGTRKHGRPSSESTEPEITDQRLTDTFDSLSDSRSAGAVQATEEVPSGSESSATESISTKPAPSPESVPAGRQGVPTAVVTTEAALKTPAAGVLHTIRRPPPPPHPLTLVAMVVTSFLQTLSRGQGAPAPGLTLQETLYAVRREVVGYFIDRSPTAAPVTLMQGAGTVSGTLAHSDADEDAVIFTVTRPPTQGGVVVHGDGTFTYTPDQSLAVAGGTDTFEVTIDDQRRSLFLFGPNGIGLNLFGRSGTVTVPVTVEVLRNAHLPVTVGSGPQAIAVHPHDGRAYVANSEDDSISVIDTTTRTEIARVRVPGYPIDVALSPLGERLYVTHHNSNTIAVLDTGTLERVATIALAGDGPSGVGFGLAVSPDGTRLYATNVRDNTLAVIDTATNTVVTEIPVGTGPAAVVAHPDGSEIYVANTLDDSVSVIKAVTGTVIGTIAVADGPLSLAITPDGSRIYTANTLHHSVSVIDTATRAVLTTIGVGRDPGAVVVSPDGRSVMVTHIDDASVSLIDTATNSVIARIRAGESPAALAFSVDGRELYVAAFDDDTLSVISLAANRPAVEPDSAAGKVVATTMRSPSAAAADPSSTDNTPATRPKGTKDFVVTNVSQYDLTFQGTKTTGYGTYREPVNGPWAGDVLKPGESVTFYIPYVAAKSDEMYATWTDSNGKEYKLRLAVSSVGQREVSCIGSPSGTCDIDHTPNSGTTAYIYWQDPSGTTVTLDGDDPAADAQRIANLLSDLCADGVARTSCNFHANPLPPGQTDLFNTGLHQVSAVVNDDPVNITTAKFTASDTRANSDSVKLGAKVGFTIGSKDIASVNAEMSAEYGHTWQYSQTFTHEVDQPVQPRSVLYVLASEPVYRDTGTFTVISGNTTYILSNIHFDSPVPGDNGLWRLESVQCAPSGCPTDIPEWYPGLTQLPAAAQNRSGAEQPALP